MTGASVLIVDGDARTRRAIADQLQSCGYALREVTCGEAAFATFCAQRPDVVLIDYRLSDGDAAELIARLHTIETDLPCIVLSGHGSIDMATQALKAGVVQVVTKPIKRGLLETLIRRMLEDRAGRKRTILQSVQDARAALDPFLGTSAAIGRLHEDARRLVGAEAPILLLGETGSGKGVLARWCHRHGPRRAEAFVDLNCAALSSQFLESELFGHERGAFTGAVAAKQGLLEIADRGVVFLDEIGDMDLAIQPKLLKVLEDRRFRRLGEPREREVSVRLIAATHHDLSARVAAEQFRRDLYFRIGGLPLVVPPLRERLEDLPILVDDLLSRISAELGRPGMQVSSSAMAALRAYSWPGNLRELKNLLERAVLLTDGAVIGVRDLRLHARGDTSSAASSGSSAASSAVSSVSAAGAEDDTLATIERRHVERIYEAEGQNVARAAVRLGIPRSSLYQKLARWGLLRKLRNAG